MLENEAMYITFAL